MILETRFRLGSGLAAAALAVLGMALAVEPSVAAGRHTYRGDSYGLPGDDLRGGGDFRGENGLRGDSQADAQAEQGGQGLTGRAVLAVISIRDQKISLYDAHGGALRSRVSSGQNSLETPVGTYSVLQKQEEHYSNVYDDASMPFMQRITWSGLALHGGVLPGYPASHGCVRLHESFAQQIFPQTKLGMRVVISAGDVAPADIKHPSLWQPKPIGQVAVGSPGTELEFAL